MNTLDRIKQYIEYKGLSVRQFEDSTGFSNGAFGSQQKKGKTIGVDKLENILHVYSDLNAEWVLTGKGSMLKSDGAPTPDSLPVAKPADPALGIPLIPSEAFCGYGTPAFDDQAIEEFYYVAEFKQADFLIRVKGNSMYPKYSSGDIIACRKVHELLYFQWNKIYAIYTNSQGIMVKRVRESSKGDDYATLISDNPNYAPFDIPRSDISAIAIVIGVIRLE